MELPQRIVDGGAGDWEGEIIRSARADVPSEQFRADLRQQLGLLTGAAGVTATSSATAKGVASLAWLKWMAVGASIGALTAGGAALRVSAPNTTANAARTATARAHAVSAVVAPRSPGAPTVSTDTDEAAAGTKASAPPVAKALPSSGSRATGAAVSRSSAKPPNIKGSELAAELGMIHSVRSALAANDAATALRSLDAYEQRYPKGRFAIEATVLRVDALAALGDHAMAGRLAQRFLAAHADSPYAERLRALVKAEGERTP